MLSVSLSFIWLNSNFYTSWKRQCSTQQLPMTRLKPLLFEPSFYLWESRAVLITGCGRATCFICSPCLLRFFSWRLLSYLSEMTYPTRSSCNIFDWYERKSCCAMLWNCFVIIPLAALLYRIMKLLGAFRSWHDKIFEKSPFVRFEYVHVHPVWKFILLFPTYLETVQWCVSH